MNVIVCFKWVKDEEDILIHPDSRVDLSRAKGKISDYDRNAIETARLIAGATECKAIGLTFGTGDVKKSLKDALSRGLDEAYWVSHELADRADGFVTAQVLTAAIRKIGDYFLIICAEGAADTYSHQIGPRIAEILDIPVVSCVTGLQIENNGIIATRKLESNLETVQTGLPVLITIMPEINSAPLPGLKAVLDANKKPTIEIQLEDLELSVSCITPKREICSLTGYAVNRKREIYSAGTSSEKIEAFVKALKREGVI